MRFTRELPANVNLIRNHSAEGILVGDQCLRTSFLVSATELIADWRPRAVRELIPEDFATALEWQPEIVLLGTGARQEFPAREIHSTLLSRGIGFEVMDTGAACRTFNVLVGESRRVVAGFLFAAQ